MVEKEFIIIKRHKKKKPMMHYGGSWKIAYADFVTAMMAFFLLMWLVSISTENVKKGIADYFSASLINFNARAGSSGVLDRANASSINNSEGKSQNSPPEESAALMLEHSSKKNNLLEDAPEIEKEPLEEKKRNAQVADNNKENRLLQKYQVFHRSVIDYLLESQERLDLKLQPDEGNNDNRRLKKESPIALTGLLQQFQRNANRQAKLRAHNAVDYLKTYQKDKEAVVTEINKLTEVVQERLKKIREESKKKEEANKTWFRLSEEIRRLIRGNPELQGIKENLLIDILPDGLRIQLIDQDKRSMFALGNDKSLAHTKSLLKVVAAIIKKTPNAISITGYTDSKPYSAMNGYSNWELSTARANATRRILQKEGVASKQFSLVVGKAATEPRDPLHPHFPINRRIDITLLNKKS